MFTDLGTTFFGKCLMCWLNNGIQSSLGALFFVHQTAANGKQKLSGGRKTSVKERAVHKATRTKERNTVYLVEGDNPPS